MLFRRPCPRFSMQSVEVYKLHSFLTEVYSFWQGRRRLRISYDNICAFLECITPNSIFLFVNAFVIIIVYNGCFAEAPFHTRFSTSLGGEQK